MIRRLILENWKGYRRLDLELHAGTTFVIARNGIGKTSLVEGAMWALFGEASEINPATSMRAGSLSTTSTVEVELDSDVVQISRTFSSDTAKTETALTIGDEVSVGDRAVHEAMQTAFGAEPSLLARMSFLREGEAVGAAASESANLRAHLEKAFGVDVLVKLANAEAARQGRLVTETRATRRTQRLAESERLQLRERVRLLEETLTGLRDDQEVARSAVATARQALLAANEWAIFDAAVLKRQDELAELVRRAHQDGIEAATDSTIAEVLAGERSRLLDRLEQLSGERGRWDGELRTIEDLLSTLDTDEGTCPVCLRPVAQDERMHAQTQHADRIHDLRERVQQVDREIGDLRQRLSHLETLQADVSRALAEQPGPQMPRPQAPHERAEEQLGEAQMTAEQLAARLSETERERDNAREQLDDDAASEALSSELFRGYREEALSEMTSTVLLRTAHGVVAERINPLATEIRHRWKTLWPDRAPIELLPDGSLVALRGDNQVPYKEFSGGEKIMATVILRLLALSMTTTAPFIWLDEPLEHLDPRNRRMVASLLAKASQGDTSRQIVATTYEEAVARRLDETQSAHLVYVEAEPAS